MGVEADWPSIMAEAAFKAPSAEIGALQQRRGPVCAAPVVPRPTLSVPRLRTIHQMQLFGLCGISSTMSVTNGVPEARASTSPPDLSFLIIGSECPTDPRLAEEEEESLSKSDVWKQVRVGQILHHERGRHNKFCWRRKNLKSLGISWPRSCRMAA